MKNIIFVFALIAAISCDVSHIVQGDGWYKDETGYHYNQPNARFDAPAPAAPVTSYDVPSEPAYAPEPAFAPQPASAPEPVYNAPEPAFAPQPASAPEPVYNAEPAYEMEQLTMMEIVDLGAPEAPASVHQDYQPIPKLTNNDYLPPIPNSLLDYLPPNDSKRKRQIINRRLKNRGRINYFH